MWGEGGLPEKKERGKAIILKEGRRDRLEESRDSPGFKS